VNTAFIDAAPTISRDGLTLIFMSDRPGNVPGSPSSGTSHNAFDLWMTTRLNASQPMGWGPAVHLGAVVNSSYGDQTPHLSPDGLALYLSSSRPTPVGPAAVYGLWVARRHSLSEPFGPPVSLVRHFMDFASVGDPHLSPDGMTLFFGSNGLASAPAQFFDLWQVAILPPPRLSISRSAAPFQP
jgi:Tol biopolymer transport system component